MACWFWNIDAPSQEYFKKELEAGRLRQGWGYDARLDLRRLRERRERNEVLTEEEDTAWNRCADMLRIAEGDLIAVKNVPAWSTFTLVKVSGAYTFALDPAVGDFGHLLPVIRLRAFNRHSQFVPASVANALNREQNPLRVTYKHAAVLLSLSERAPGLAEDDTLRPEKFKEKIERLRAALRMTLKEKLQTELTPSEAERLVGEMLRRDGNEATWTAGPSEQGADLIAATEFGYGLQTRVAVQVKKHFGHDNDVRGMDQLEEAFEKRRTHAGLLVSMADTLGPAVSSRLEELKKHREVRILYGDDLYRRLLELIADSNHEFLD